MRGGHGGATAGYWTTEGYFFDDANPPPVVSSISIEATCCVPVKQHWDHSTFLAHDVQAELTLSHEIAIFPDLLSWQDASQQDTVLRCARLSVRVRRGPDWCWNSQDGGAGSAPKLTLAL